MKTQEVVMNIPIGPEELEQCYRNGTLVAGIYKEDFGMSTGWNAVMVNIS